MSALFLNAQKVDSDLPTDKKWKLVWNDEFNGNTLDTTKWGFRLHIMQTRHTTYTDDANEFDGKGNLYCCSLLF